MIVAFDNFEVDTDAFELRHDGEPVPLEPQVFDVLAYLVSNGGRLVTKVELLDEIWGDRFVSESALTSRIKAARRALGDDGRTQRYIKTVHGRGYRFEAPGASPPQRQEAVGTDGAPARVDNLPAERTPLLGRDGDLVDVLDALADDRLVTVLAIGGTGKTRLAIAAAREAAPRFGDGVLFIDLVPLEDADDIDAALATAAGLSIGTGSSRAQIVALLAERQMLIVLDNAEHLVTPVGDLLDDLLEATTGPRVLVTSRVPLGLADERRLTLRPLAIGDDGDGPAIDLFARSAKLIGGAVDLDDRALMIDLCRRLDGLPLAIELAAAQLRHLDLPSLAARLDERLDVLAREGRGPDRHASLVAVLSDTWGDLDEHEVELLTLISAFPARFELADLEAVVAASDGLGADIDATLRRLMDRSLVVRDGGSPPRFRLLETVKLDARQRSGPGAVAALDAHARWCSDMVGDDPSRSLLDFDLSDWCASHHYDLRAAGRHLTSTGSPGRAAALTAATALAMHCDPGPRAAETLQRLPAELAAADTHELTARLRLVGVMCGMATRAPDEIAEQGRLALEAAQASADPTLISLAQVLRSWSMVFRDPDEAIRLVSDAGGRAAQDGHQPLGDFADGYRAVLLALVRRYDEATELATSVLDRAPDGRRQYPTHVALVAFTSINYLAEPSAMLRWADEVGETPTPENSMWANDLVAASIHASLGDVERCREVCEQIDARLRTSGRDAFPDLLIPIATLALRSGDRALSRRWVRAVRNAEVGTQSFQATVLYRRISEEVGPHEAPPETTGSDDIDLGEVASEALDWLHTR